MNRVQLFQILVIVCCFAVCALGQDIHLNEIQVLGSHNSYHHAAVPTIWVAANVQYTHPPVRDQLHLGIRQLEFDLFSPLGKNDFAVGHVKNDFGTTCYTLSMCFQQVADWSADALHLHAPLFIYVEIKDQLISIKPGAIEGILSGIESVADRIFKDQYLSARELRANASSLREALITPSSASSDSSKWPTYNATRGRVIVFVTGLGLDHRDASIRQQAITAISQQNRTLFAMIDPNSTFVDANFSVILDASDIVDEPNGVERINYYSRQGYLIRVRADAELAQIRARNFTTANRARSSGAQLISSDLPYAPSKGGGNYSVRFSETHYGVRCNPVLTSTANCTTAGLEPAAIAPPFPPRASRFWCCGRGIFVMAAFAIAALCFLVSLVFFIILCCWYREAAGADEVDYYQSEALYHDVDTNRRTTTSLGLFRFPASFLRILLFLSFLAFAAFLLLPIMTRAYILRQRIRGVDAFFALVVFLERAAVALFVFIALQAYEPLHLVLFRQYAVVSVLCAVGSILTAFFNRWGAANLRFWNNFNRGFQCYFPILIIENISFLITAVGIAISYGRSISAKRFVFFFFTSIGCLQLLVLTLLGAAGALPAYYDVVPKEERATVWYLLLRSVEIASLFVALTILSSRRRRVQYK